MEYMISVFGKLLFSLQKRLSSAVATRWGKIGQNPPGSSQQVTGIIQSGWVTLINCRVFVESRVEIIGDFIEVTLCFLHLLDVFGQEFGQISRHCPTSLVNQKVLESHHLMYNYHTLTTDWIHTESDRDRYI